jgi:hypothetical protein
LKEREKVRERERERERERDDVGATALQPPDTLTILRCLSQPSFVAKVSLSLVLLEFLLETSCMASPVLIETSYRSTSLIRKRTPLGPYSRTMPRGLWWS